MKKVTLFSLSLLLTATAMFTGCEQNDPGENPQIVVQDDTALTQNVFADATNGNSGVTFTTTGAWTSSITEAATKSSSQAANWISIDPSSGEKAGNYTVALTLTPNTTGANRTAVITISCEGTDITITVTQRATTENGTMPEQPEGDLPQALQTALTLLKNEKDEISIDNVHQLYQIYISQWETTHYTFSFNLSAKKLFERGFNNAIGDPRQYFENDTVYVASENSKQRYHTLTDNEIFWRETPVSYYIDETIDLVGRRLNSVGLQNHQWTVAGNVYTGYYTHEELTDTIKFTLTDGKITAINSYRTQSANAPYIDKNNVTIAYTAVPNLAAGTTKGEYTPAEQYSVRFVWGEGLGETTLYTGHEQHGRGFGVYLPGTRIDLVDVLYNTPSLAGKKVAGYYFDSAFTQLADDLFYGKSLYVDNNTVVYVKWESE